MKKRVVGMCVLAFVAFWGFIGCTGWTNPETPVGHEGYVVSRPIWIGQGGYTITMKGPRKHGVSWMRFVINIDMRTKTYTEDFTGTSSVLAKDNLIIGFRAHVKISLRENSCKKIVDKYQGADWYQQIIRAQFRAFARDEIQKHRSLDIKDNITVIGDRIRDRLQEEFKGTPFVFEAVAVGNIQYPDVVTNAVSEKLAATQKLEKADIDIEIEKKNAERRVAQAEGIARAQRIINETLSDRYLQHEAIEAQTKMAESPNHTTVYIPVGSSGLPLIYSAGERQRR